VLAGSGVIGKITAYSGSAGDPSCTFGSCAIIPLTGIAISLSVDTGDTLYISDMAGNRAHKLPTFTSNHGVVAGTGAGHTPGDGDDGRDATLNGPEGVRPLRSQPVHRGHREPGRPGRIDKSGVWKSGGDNRDGRGSGNSGNSGAGESEGSKRDAEYLPPQEVANAALHVLEQHVSLPVADLVRETARLLGYQRTGPAVDKAIRGGIGVLVKNLGAKEEGGIVIWVSTYTIF
jgi:hypothetical protein